MKAAPHFRTILAALCVIGLSIQGVIMSEETVYQFTVKDRQGAEVALEQYRGQVLLIVNTATRCGFTPQYEGLEAMYERLRGKGFELLDFPCNQFGQQAPGTDEEIHSFCQLNYKTAFPQFAKVEVNGENAAPLFKFLVANTTFEGFPSDGKIAPLLEKMLGEADPDYAKKPDIKWNFTKFLIGRDGRILRRFEPTAALTEVEAAIVAALGGQAALTARETAIVDLGAALARGDQAALASALNAGFDAGLTLNEAKELIGQLYAYCGFPRALNAATTLMKVAQSRPEVPAGAAPNPPPAGRALDFGTANQTKLCGGPVQGPLFDFHPQLDEYLKAHLFGDIFARDNVDWRTRELVTIAALAARPETAPQLQAHLGIGRLNGVTEAQGTAIVARVQRPAAPSQLPADWSAFPIGQPNTAYAQYFIGNSYLAPLTLEQVPTFSVTFEPGCRNNWHVHHAATGGGQMLIVTAGEGYYQEWGKPARRLKPGDVVNIPANVKHWHGAAPNSWFQHIAQEIPGTEQSNEWLEPVDDAAYAKATE